MAYDPNDPADKKIVKDLIAAAIAEQAAEHEQDTQGLKNKNAELVLKLKKAQEGTPDAKEFAQIETQLEKAQGELKIALKEAKIFKAQAEEYKQNFEQESNVTRNLLVENGLTEALTKANVGAPFIPAVKAMLTGRVELKSDGTSKIAVIGEKSLGDFVKEWSQGDEGKHYVSAPINGGAGAGGSRTPNGSNAAKTITRAAYEQMASGEVQAFVREGGKIVDAS
jgi:hypothetical protein